MSATRGRRRLLLLLLAFRGAEASAHELGVARVLVTDRGGGEYRVEVQPAPSAGVAALKLPETCRLLTAGAAATPTGPPGLRYTIRCDALGPDASVRLAGIAEAIVLLQRADGSSAGRIYSSGPDGVGIALGGIAGDDPGVAEVARRYAVLGIGHILKGADHLAFVLLLCLLSSGWSLLRQVSAFTLGHSLTLALAALDVVRLQSAPVEATIALSVAFLARQLVVEDRLRHGAPLVFAFGLLHGLGFAGALAAAGLPRGQLVLGLLAFNTGVELGQVGFVVLAVGVLAMAPAGFAQAVQRLVGYGLGGLGLLWALERTLAFGT